MCNRILLTSVLLGLSLLQLAQESYAQPFPTTEWSFGGRTIYSNPSTMRFAQEMPDGSITSGSSNGYLFHFSADGELLETIQLSDSAGYSPVQMLQFHNDFYLLANVILPDSDHVDFAVFKYSPDLILQDFNVFSFPDDNAAIRLLESDWSTLIVVGEQSHSWAPRCPWFAEIDSGLMLIRRHEFIQQHRFSPTGATIDQDGNIFISGSRASSSDNATLAKVDTSGTIHWRQNYHDTYIPKGYVPWKHKTHLLAGIQMDGAGYFLVIDSTGIEIERVTNLGFDVYACVLASRGSVVVVGDGGAIAKFDSTLTLQWARSLNRINFWDTFFGVRETSEHHYLCFGEAVPSYDYDAFYDRYIVETGPDLGVIAGPTPNLSIVQIDGVIRLDWQAVSQLPMRYRILEAATSDAAYSFLCETSATQFDILPLTDMHYYRIYSIYDTVANQGNSLEPEEH